MSLAVMDQNEKSAASRTINTMSPAACTVRDWDVPRKGFVSVARLGKLIDAVTTT